VSSLLARIKAFLSTPLFNNIRAVLYVAVPAGLWQLVAQGHLSQDAARLWSAIVVAAAAPTLASIFAPKGFKTYLAGLLVPVQGLLVYLGGTNNTWFLLASAVVGSILSSGLWAANVHAASSGEATPDATATP
jgi:hypothetical protein